MRSYVCPACVPKPFKRSDAPEQRYGEIEITLTGNMSKIWKRMMGKQDSSWRRVLVLCVLVLCDSVSGKQMSETLQRALSAVRGPSPGAKKLLNIPEDGGQMEISFSV
ncbi:unnamed protein product, partial [Brenthis ino]